LSGQNGLFMKIRHVYNAHPTISHFHASRAFHRCIRGPRGSGKSTGCSMELMVKGQGQEPDLDMRRHTRFAVIRNTYRELEDTTLKTWLRWFPEDHFGVFNYNKMRHMIRWRDLEMEVLFRALDRPGDVRKTLSLELTGAWVNEAREVPFSIIEALGDAVGRYPPVVNGKGGPTWQGILMDTNSPDSFNWWYRLSEKEKGKLNPEMWEFFNQPGGLIERDGEFYPNPEAENLLNLKVPSKINYYMFKKEGKTLDHIRIYYCNQYGFIVEGRPVHPEFVDAVHVAKEILYPVPDRVIYIGIDFGLTPAALFGQRLVDGRWIVFEEVISEHMGTARFADMLLPVMNGKYKGFKFQIYGDPAGDNESETDERTPFQILAAKGIKADKAWRNNDTTIRRESLRAPLLRLIDGRPGFLLSPTCEVTRHALKGGFHYRRIQVSGVEKYHEKPEKNQYSHPAEACEYMCLGAGEGQLAVGSQPKVTAKPYKAPHYREQRLGWMA